MEKDKLSYKQLLEHWRLRRISILATANSGRTLASLSAEFDISRERVRQIFEEAGVKKLDSRYKRRN